MSEGGQMYVTLLGGCIAPFYVVPDHNAPFVYLWDQYLGDPENQALFSVR